jgi:hypothetical protein
MLQRFGNVNLEGKHVRSLLVCKKKRYIKEGVIERIKFSNKDKIWFLTSFKLSVVSVSSILVILTFRNLHKTNDTTELNKFGHV